MSSDDPLYGADATWSEDAPASPDVPRGDRYELREVLGEGATGVVEAVYDRVLDRVVARKRPKGGTTFDAPTFLREARLTARLQHPTVVRIYDAGFDEDGPYYTMERVDGQTLRQAWRQVPAEERHVFLPILRAAAEGMASAHEVGVVHRDLKPANVMLGRLGRTWVVDFGLGRSTAEPSAQAVGTPRYMSPEQARGEATDPRSDVWSLGAMLYELTAGHPPYQGPSQEVLAALRRGTPPPPLPPDRSPELVAIVTRAMAPDAHQRYPHAGALAADLAAFQRGEAVSAYRYRPREALVRWMRQHARRLALGVIALVALVGVGLAGAASQLQTTLVERDRALAAEREARHALALSLEAQARQAVGRPEEAIPLARQALSLASDLPWARGVLAAHPDFEPTQPTWYRQDEGCHAHVIGDELLLVCPDELVTIGPDGAERRHHPRDPGHMVYGDRIWRGDDWQLTPLTWGDQGLVPDGAPITLSDRTPRRFSTGWPDAPIVEVAVDAVRLPTPGDSPWIDDVPWGSIPYQIACHHDDTCIVLGAHASWRCTDRFATCAPWSAGFPALVVAWHPVEPHVLAVLTDGRLVADRGTGVLEVFRRPQGQEVRQVAWAGDGFVSLDVTGTVRHHAPSGQVLATVDASAASPHTLHVVGDMAITNGLHGQLGVRLDDRPRQGAVAVLPHGISALAADGDQLWVGAVGNVWHVDAQARITNDSTRDLGALVIKDIAIDGDRLFLGLNHLQDDPSLDRHGLVQARRVARTEGHYWHSTYARELLVDPPLPTTWQSHGDIGAGRDAIALESARGVVSVVGDDGVERYRSPPLTGEAWAIGLSDDGTVLVYADSDHRLYRVHVPSGDLLTWDSGHRAPIATLAVSPDGTRIASGSWDATARVFDTDGELLLGLEGHDGRVIGTAFLDDDRMVTASWDATVRFWDLSIIP